MAINVKNLESLVKELRTAILDADIDNINEIENAIADLNNKVEQKKEFERTLEDKNNIKLGFMKNREKTERELNELIKGQDYKKLNELKANKEVILASMREHNSKLIHAFSVMERPLKKLLRVVIEDTELLNKYIENPVLALISDHSLKIIKLLQRLEKNLNDYTLDLKDKKREKVLETIKGLNEEFFRDFVYKHKELDERLKSLEKEISENEAFKTENKINYELSNVNDSLEKINNEIVNNEKELGRIDVDGMKNNLEKEINGLLKINVAIS